ncbi:hypothetical protein CAPTEDRAFT_186000 [Capitella teleta]|uniref:Multiple inositol polyphosphate phosphatase 1 n=1 Tax=Capitella teleta TaxID=283909 RepID=R7V439_CAPTE|nr:hypothetical protein CAPTEDRAFT_186000 [Capitella teleta]|eukprot:ELU13329.1 hypothetical protein CAPTEDRAFT_186000 [Capitella teleta]
MKFVIVPSLLVLTFILLCESKPPSTNNYCYSTDPSPNRNYVTKTPYDISRNQDEPQNEAIEGCTAIHMWMVSRHGHRFSSANSMQEVSDFLLSIHDDVINGQNELCAEDLTALHDWEPLNEPSMAEMLTETGWNELRLLGNNFKIRAPELLDQEYSGEFYDLRHSNYSEGGDRTRDSARAFCEGVWGTYEGVVLDEQGEPDWLIHFYKYCDKYIEEVKNQPIEEAVKFDTGPVVAEMVERVEQRLGLQQGLLDFDAVSLIWESCRVEWGVRVGDSPWCAAFTAEDLVVMEYSEDIKYYYDTSYPSNISYEQACPLVQDLVDAFTGVIDGDSEKRLSGAFGHSSTINMFLTRLGLHKDDAPLTADAFPYEDRQWKVTDHCPMASNVVFVLYECESSEYKVKSFVNEFPVIVPGCDDFICDWERLRQNWQPIVESCDIEGICSWP